MATPADAVLWQEQVALPRLADPRAPLGDDARVDVLIVGGGYAGLAAAIEVARAGRRVLVVEKGPIGDGAHARNGGMAIPELKAGPATLQRTYGELGSRLHAEVHAAFDHLEARIADEGIACDYVRSGQLYLAHSPRVVPHLRDLVHEHADDFGEPVRFVERDALGDEIGSTAFHGGVVYDRTGGLHPAKLHAALLGHALAAGASVRDRCAATAIEDSAASSGRFRVQTERGPVVADHLIVTTNATADRLLPELQRRVLPIGSFIVATEPLDPEVAAAVSPKGRMFVNTKNLLFYWRLTPDGRMAFGGRRSLQHTTVAEAAEYLATSMVEVHPQLAGVGVTHRWGGQVAITLDRLPHVGRLRGAWYATGCNGSGVALNTWLGHRLGLVVLGRAAPPAFAELRHRPIPARALRRWYLPAVGQWFRWQDRP